MQKIVIAPHPDDEYIGCYSLFKSNQISKVIVATNNYKQFAYQDMTDETYTALRKEETSKFCQSCGLSKNNIIFLDFIDGNLINTNKLELFQKLVVEINKEDTIYIPSPFGSHPDHTVVACISLLIPAKRKLLYSITRDFPETLNKEVIHINPNIKWKEFANIYKSQYKRLVTSGFPFRDSEEFVEV